MFTISSWPWIRQKSKDQSFSSRRVEAFPFMSFFFPVVHVTIDVYIPEEEEHELQLGATDER